MKNWWVLAWDTYYPNGGLGNVHSTWPTFEQANETAEGLSKKGKEIYDDVYHKPDHVEVINIMDML